ncbi:MAG: DUF3293 domain-containing protein [Saprospiraceae bacterium]|nr:DUF3293 domain-containing protein [Saprospiraceae bacterium]
MLENYKATTYRVFVDNGQNIDVLIGQKNAKLDSFLQANKAKTYAVITAWNPYSSVVSMESNHASNLSLESELKQFSYLNGIGIPAQPSDWEGEKSFFVMDITKEESSRLGIAFKQNAIVFGCINKAPEVIMLV